MYCVQMFFERIKSAVLFSQGTHTHTHTHSIFDINLFLGASNKLVGKSMLHFIHLLFNFSNSIMLSIYFFPFHPLKYLYNVLSK
jgi:hypothetical protein